MKHITTSALCLLLVFSFFVSSVPRAQAELTEQSKAQLKAILAENNSSGGILDIVTYLYSVMYTLDPADSSSSTEVSTGKTDLCSQVKQLTKNLEKRVDDPQVKVLQRLLNTIALEKGQPYKRVAESGAGSYGNETTYYGEGTAAALEQWQSTHKVLFFGLKAGILEAKTREKMKSEYCSDEWKVNPVSDFVQVNVPDSDSGVADTSTNNENKSVDSKKMPKIAIDKSVIKKGEKVTLTFTENGLKNCRLFTKVGKKDSKVTLSEIENPYSVAPEKTSEYRLGCSGGFRMVYSDWVGVIVN